MSAGGVVVVLVPWSRHGSSPRIRSLARLYPTIVWTMGGVTSPLRLELSLSGLVPSSRRPLASHVMCHLARLGRRFS